jgi:cell wall-associated NlpC family hydrolase
MKGGKTMAMIAPLTGTTEDYKSVEDILILQEREIGVEIASRDDLSTYTIIRQGDGKNKFFDLNKIFDQSEYEDALKETQNNMQRVSTFANNMNNAAESANNAATKATTAATEATAAAKACEGIVDGLNTMVDTVTGKSCVLGVEDGILVIKEA